MLTRLFSPFLIYRGLPKDIYALALAKLIQGIGNFINPFVMLLMTQKLGASPAHAGLILLLLTASNLLGNASGGKAADRFGHKETLLVGECFAALSLMLCGIWPTDPLWVPAGLLGYNFFLGLALPASNALLADLSTPRNRDAVMSLGYLAYNLGSGIGPLAAGYLFWHYTRWMFWGNCTAYLIAMSLIYLGVRTTHLTAPLTENRSSDLTKQPAVQRNENDMASCNAPQQAEIAESTVTGSVWQVLRQRPYLLVFSLCCMLLYFSLNQMVIALPLYLSHQFHQQGPIVYGQLMTYASLLVAFLTPILLRLTRRLSTLQSTALSGANLILGYLLVLGTHSIPMQYIAWFFLTSAEILLITHESIYIANETPRSHRGRINGVLTTLRNLGLMPQALLTGLAIQFCGFSGTWLIVVAIALVAGASLLWLDRARQRTSGRTAILNE